jgi:hypothetical protein
MTAVRDLYLEALAMRSKNVPSLQILEHLIKRGHETGGSTFDTLTDGEKYELFFRHSGEKISFDGTDYHFDAKLSDVLQNLDETSLSHLIRDHEAGKLEQVCRAA